MNYYFCCMFWMVIPGMAAVQGTSDDSQMNIEDPQARRQLIQRLEHELQESAGSHQQYAVLGMAYMNEQDPIKALNSLDHAINMARKAGVLKPDYYFLKASVLHSLSRLSERAAWDRSMTSMISSRVMM